jgi:hypothetical protein
VPSFQVANGTSQTFELVPEAFQGITSFELQVGDRIEGSFTFSNLGPYRSLLDGTWVTYWIDVWLLDPEGEKILTYTHTSGDSFNYTVLDWGDYNLGAYCSSNAFLQGAKYPEMTINFEIVKAVMPEPASPDLMAWWKLNEGNGTVVFDSSWHNRQGNIQGANWTNVDGNDFLDFDGESDYVKLPSLPLASLDALTVSAWVNSDLTKDGSIMYHGNKGEFQLGNGDCLEEQNSGRYSDYARFSVSLSDYYWYNVSSSYPMKPNTWHHIVGVWIKGASLKVYVDGTLAGENDKIAPERLYDAGGSFPSSLGVRSQAQYLWDNPCFFKGQMSNIMVYNRALSGQEIENLTTQIAESLSIPKPSHPATEPFPTTLVIASSVASVAIIVASLLVYFKKRKR